MEYVHGIAVFSVQAQLATLLCICAKIVGQMLESSFQDLYTKKNAAFGR